MTLSLFLQQIKPYFIKDDKIIEYPISLLALPNWPRYKNKSRQDVEIWKIVTLTPSFLKLYCRAERIQKPYIILICLDGSGRLIVKKSYPAEKDYQFLSNKEILDKFDSKEIKEEVKISDLHINSKVLLQGDKDVWTVSYIFGLNNTVRVEKETESNDLPQYIRTTKSIDMIRKILPESKSRKLVESLLFEISSPVSYPFSLGSRNKKEWEYDFDSDSKLEYTVYYTFLKPTEVEISFHFNGGTTKSMSNKNEQFRVLSTVAETTKDFIKKNSSVDKIIINGQKEENEEISRRSNIYSLYLKKHLSSEWDSKVQGNIITIFKK